MALWQILDTKDGRLPEQWDDGLQFQPGDQGFTTAKIGRKAGAGNYNYIACPNRQERIMAEAATQGGE